MYWRKNSFVLEDSSEFISSSNTILSLSWPGKINASSALGKNMLDTYLLLFKNDIKDNSSIPTIKIPKLQYIAKSNSNVTAQ